MTHERKRFGILVGGGPAPGINSVIASVTIAARERGHEVIGIYEGFKGLSQGVTQVLGLDGQDVSRLHLEGGSILRTSRFNPTKDEKDLQAVVNTLVMLGVTHLVTIGGDDTAYGASRVSQWMREKLGKQILLCHVPKTIDNDLPLPQGIPTFGFETARALGASLVANLMEDARTGSRWFFIIAMGRKAGHLALGMGKSAGAALTLLPEEFGGERPRMKALVDIIAGSIIKRMSRDLPYGVAVLAEGLLEIIDEKDLDELDNVERDPYGNIRLAEVDFSDLIKVKVRNRLKELGVKPTIVDKEIGYELRCVGPNAFDIEYTRNLGWAAVQFLDGGGTDAIISVQNLEIVPMFFRDIMNPTTGKTDIRFVDVQSIQYRVARQYMDRLEESDFRDEARLEKLAAVVHKTAEEFRKEFEYLTRPAGKRAGRA